MQDRLVNELLHRAYGHGPELTGQILALHPNSNTSTSCLWINSGGAAEVTSTSGAAPAFQLEFYHRLDHLGAETSPDTLRRGYLRALLHLTSSSNVYRLFCKRDIDIAACTDLGWGEPKADEEPVGFWGLKATPGFGSKL
eukprot:COSAG04_NODE_3227_length_3026_cov_3.689785_4_plen_140_part_00